MVIQASKAEKEKAKKMLRRVRAYLRKLAALAQEWVDPNGAKLPKLEEADVDAVKLVLLVAFSFALLFILHDRI